MVLDKVTPSNFTLTIFIKLFGKLGRINQIFELVDDFPKMYNFVPNEHVFTCIMSACISNRQVSREFWWRRTNVFLQYQHVYKTFVKIVEMVSSRGALPDSRSFETALGGLYRGSFYSEGLEVLKLVYNLPNNLLKEIPRE